MAWDRFTHPRNPKFGAPTQLQVRMQNDAPRPCASAQIMNPQPRPQTTQSAKKSTIHEREEVFFTQFGIFNFLLGIFNFRSSRRRENAEPRFHGLPLGPAGCDPNCRSAVPPKFVPKIENHTCFACKCKHLWVWCRFQSIPVDSS